AEQTYTSYNGLPSTALIAGTNVLAVEVHQRDETSSDIGFNLSLNAGSPPGQPDVVRGPYLQIGTSTSVVVKWRTDNPSDSKITYGTSPGNLNQSVTSGTSTTEHEMTISGLSPNTTYYYTIGTSIGPIEGGTADYSFTTSPVPGTNQPVRAWVLGDCGTADGNAAAVRNAYENYVNTNSLHTDMILMLGDNAYNSGTDSEYQAAVFNMYTNMLRKAVLWACPGNHDYGTINAYLNIFTQPTSGQAGGIGSGTERYYSFDYGNIHFISLDSHGSPRNVGGAQYNWLQNDLNNTTADWIVAYWHHPAYTNGSHNSDSESFLIQMRENFLPLLEAHGVDLVLSGHSHSYERTFLLNGHYGYSNSLTGSMILDNGDGDPTGDGAYDKNGSGDGAVYITAGSSGKISGVSSFPMMYTWQNALGSVVIETQNDEMRVRFLRSNGSFTDDFTITKDISNQAPIVLDDSESSFQGVAVTVDVLDNDSDPNSNIDNSSVSIISAPSKGTINSINPATGEITYTPFPNATGNDVFTYEVCDDGVPSPVLCGQANVTINILVNTAPVAYDDNGNTNENTNLVIDVVSNDTDAENNLDPASVQIVSNPSDGTITSITPSGIITYQPNTNFTGSDSFSYSVDDDLNETSNIATVFVNVNPNITPVANDDVASTTEATSILIPVFVNDTDVNNDLDPTNSNTAGLQQALHGTVTFVSGVGYSYLPDSGFNGTDRFEYEVCDLSSPNPLCDIAVVEIFVDCIDSPNQNIIKGTVYEDADENEAFEYEVGQNGVEVSIYSDENGDGGVDNGDVLLATHNTDNDGNYSFTVNPVFTTNGSTNVLVNNDLDDAWEKNNGDMENDKNNHEMGKNNTLIGLRFRNVNIPANAIITDARLIFKASGDEDNTPSSVNIYGELSTTPAVYNEVDYGISSRSKGSSVAWNMGEWVKNQFYTSPNISGALQDVINLGGWAAGNNLAFILESTGSQRRKFFSHDGNDPVELTVDYEVPGQAEYKYVLSIDPGTLPVNGNMTTDNVETATMTSTGQTDCHNNFGFNTGPPNVLPSVSISSPTSGTFNTPQSFSIIANASDTDGTISQVEFFINGVSVGLGTESPAGVYT
ncbi:MAG: tandem-95 repeat protein, partial [Bacteroidia bacterium]|nr:tandem-95 repeat protein [Bacteroidia bacterium]